MGRRRRRMDRSVAQKRTFLVSDCDSMVKYLQTHQKRSEEVGQKDAL